MADRVLVVRLKGNKANPQQELIADADGNLYVRLMDGSTINPDKATDKYGIQAISEDATYKYFWFEDDSSNYYIVRKHKTNKTFEYAKGTGGYASVYQNSTSGPSGSPTWGSYGETF